MQSITQPNSGRWIQVLTMPFITMRRMVSLGLLNSKQPLKEESSATKLLHRINDVPLSVFIDCICDNDYKGLIISGNPTNEEIATAFEAIYEQYIEAVGGKDLLRHIRQIKEIAISQNRVVSAECIIETFKLYPTEGLYEQLYKFGYNLPKKPYNYSNVNEVLRIFVANYKYDFRKLEKLILEFESVNKSDGEKSSGYTREYFIGSLVDMSEAFKFNISEKDLSLLQYCIYINRYKAYCDAQLKKIQHG